MLEEGPPSRPGLLLPCVWNREAHFEGAVRADGHDHAVDDHLGPGLRPPVNDEIHVDGEVGLQWSPSPGCLALEDVSGRAEAVKRISREAVSS